MKKATAFCLVAIALTLAGCNTLQGVGQDVQRAGNAIERAAR